MCRSIGLIEQPPSVGICWWIGLSDRCNLERERGGDTDDRVCTRVPMTVCVSPDGVNLDIVMDRFDCPDAGVCQSGNQLFDEGGFARVTRPGEAHNSKGIDDHTCVEEGE